MGALLFRPPQGGAPYLFPLLHAGVFVRLELVLVLCVLLEFSLCSYVYQTCCVWKRPFLKMVHHLLPLQSFCLPLLEPWDQRCDKDIRSCWTSWSLPLCLCWLPSTVLLMLNIPKSPSLPVVPLCVCVFTTIYSKKPFCWEHNKALVAGSNNMLFAVILLLCSCSRIIIVGFLLKSHMETYVGG